MVIFLLSARRCFDEHVSKECEIAFFDAKETVECKVSFRKARELVKILKKWTDQKVVKQGDSLV